MAKGWYIKEADSDYIKIGNTILPTNASQYGYADYDSIARQTKRNYDDEKEAERRKAEKDRLIASASDIIKQIREKEKTEDTIDAMYDVLVPSNGKADTVAGELVRAMQRILYRAYNDGDVFYCGYGLETCGTSASYICDYSNRIISKKFDDIGERKLGIDTPFDSYDKAINDISNLLIDFIWENQELFATPNDEDSREGETAYWDDYDSFEYDVTIPDNVQWHLDREDISERDLEEEIENWSCFDYHGAPDIDIWGDSIEFDDIPYDVYEQMNGNAYDWLESYGDRLDDEYGSEYDEDDDDYYDDEDEEYDEDED